MKANYKNWVPKGMICGLGAATAGLAGARRNPQGRMVGIDRWGAEYASYSQKLCEQNASTENTANVRFQKGDTCKLESKVMMLYGSTLLVGRK